MARFGALVVGGLLLVCVAASTSPASGARQRVTVTKRNYRLVASGLDRLHAGLVTVIVRNGAGGEHGLVLFRLRRPLTRAQIVARFAANNLEDFDARGGVAVVPTGGFWEATLELSPGRYLIADGGENGGKANYARGMLEMFAVAAGGAAGTPPKTVGKIVMADYSFRISLPKRFDGRGVVAIPNRGRHLHEIALVKTPAGKTATDVLELFHSGTPLGPGYELHELLAGLGPGHTAYVRFALSQGHYVALCLVPFGKTNETHADAGMVGEFDVS